MYPDYLIHHGVKGMKWGIRKARKNQLKDVRRRLSSADRWQTEGRFHKKQAKKAFEEADKYAESARNEKAKLKAYRQVYGEYLTRTSLGTKGGKEQIMAHLTSKKGQEYANKVLQSSKNANKALNIIEGAVIAGGTAALMGFLYKRG